MRVLVTGAAGFIGSHVTDALVGRGHEVLGLDSLDSGVYSSVPPYLRNDVSYCFVDLRAWEPDERFDAIDAVVHLAALGGVARAARQPANIVGANVTGTARLLEAARKWPQLRRIVLASSFSVYGANYRYKCSQCLAVRDASRNSEDLDRGAFEVLCGHCRKPCSVLPVTEDTTPAPLETYGASKYMQELCFRGFDACPATLLRFSSVYGDRLRLDDGEATIIARLAGWIRSGVSPVLFEDGAQIRDWVYVGDLVDVITALVEHGGPDVMNICSGVPTTLLEACRILSAVTDRQDVEPHVAGGYRAGDMRHCLGDNSRMREFLGRSPVPFATGASLAFHELNRLATA